MNFIRFTLDRSTPSLWRATFNHPPINLIDSVMIRELGELFGQVERDEEQSRALACRREPERRSKTAFNNAPMSTDASASTLERSRTRSLARHVAVVPNGHEETTDV